MIGLICELLTPATTSGGVFLGRSTVWPGKIRLKSKTGRCRSPLSPSTTGRVSLWLLMPQRVLPGFTPAYGSTLLAVACATASFQAFVGDVSNGGVPNGGVVGEDVSGAGAGDLVLAWVVGGSVSVGGRDAARTTEL
jgi:hypothetical protein